MKYATITDAAQVNLSQHALIEASAGTGKTYLIENLFLRLITETDAAPSEILVITFTEKATGELRERINARLAKRLSELHEEGKHQSAEAQRLRRALDSFDEAAIETIHGFCYRMLREYAFETRQSFAAELTDDSELAAESLALIQRGWAEAIPDLEKLLAAGRYPHYDFYFNKSRFEDAVLRVALLYREGSPHQLLPAPSPTLAELARGFTEKQAAAFAPGLPSRTVLDVQAEVRSRKAELGLVSYNDMLTHLATALDDATTRDTIRARFSHAIVDEFQDTDEVQWQILKRLFLHDSRQLIVVGDPKQSIYGFRGADVRAYIACRKEMETLSARGKAQLFRQEICFRSTPELIDGLNKLFAAATWFAAHADGITYHPVKAGPEKLRRFTGLQDPSKRSAFVAMAAEGAEKASRAKRWINRFVAEECYRMTVTDKVQIETRAEGVRPLHAGDICVLVRSRREADFLENCLRKLRIPFTFYRKPGLFASTEALEVLYLLEALAKPESDPARKRLLLTGFFGVPPEEINDYAALSPEDPIPALITDWAALARRGAWPELFRSALRESMRHTSLGEEGYERRRENLHQITEELEVYATNARPDVAELAQYLARLRAGAADNDESAVHRRDTEDHRLQIMTIHAAKGLEFPIVFVTGGLTELSPTNLTYFDYYSGADSDRKRVFDLNGIYRKNSLPADYSVSHYETAEASFEVSRRDEDRRLFYVAATRAALRVYLPFFKKNRRHQNDGPMIRFGYPAIDAVVEALPDVAEGIVLKEGPLMRLPDPDTPSAAATTPRVPVRSDLFPAPPRMHGRTLEIRSFSSIERRVPKTASIPVVEESPDTAAETAATTEATEERASPPEASVQKAHFPGKRGGNMLHNLFETVDFKSFGSLDMTAPVASELPMAEREIITERLSFYRYLQNESESQSEIVEEAARLVAGTLTAPIEKLSGLRLCDLAPTDRIHEMEFTFEMTETQLDALRALEGRNFRIRRGYVNGFIDLVFRSGGRYYLADWKSNQLAAYDQNSIASFMEASEYALQARIYTCALTRWLRGVIPDFNYDRDFGGTFYFFIRGMRPDSGTDGIFHTRPKESDVEQFLQAAGAS